MFIEIFVTHKIDEEKLNKIKSAGISTIEIDLSKMDREMTDTPVSKFLKSKSAYRAKEAKENTFFEDIQLVSKAVKNNSCQTVIPTTKRDC